MSAPPGVKHDADKPFVWDVIQGFSLAVEAVAQVGTFGANKYSLGGWEKVPDGKRRYSNAFFRHVLKDMQGEMVDPESGALHAAHAAWNALARLELILREERK